MKTNLFKIAAIALVVAGGLAACREKNEDENPYPFEASCENKTILKTFENEQGFLRAATDPLIDRVFYCFFEPITPHNEFSDRLLFLCQGGTHGYLDLEKYANEMITVSGNVTNCLYPIRQQHPDGDYGFVIYEYNILELSSISIKGIKK